MFPELRPCILTPDLLYHSVQTGNTLKFVRQEEDIFVASDKYFHKEICGCNQCQDAGLLYFSSIRVLVCGQSSGLDHLDLKGEVITSLNLTSEAFRIQRELTCGVLRGIIYKISDNPSLPAEVVIPVYYSLLAAVVIKSHPELEVLYSAV